MSELFAIEPGCWVLIQHWRGPIAQVSKVTSKRVHLGRGYCEPTDVKAVFSTEDGANAGYARYRAAWLAAQDELKIFEQARKDASAAYLAAERRLKQAAWDAARADV